MVQISLIRTFYIMVFVPIALLPAILSIAVLTLYAAANTDRPNIVLIYVDDLGYGDLGSYGSKFNETPYVDQLAREGMRFMSYYTASALCTSSRAALLTGSYPARVSFDAFYDGSRERAVLFPGYAHGLHPDELLLPEYLNEHGYATAHIGKWHLGDQPEHLPTRHGFDYYFGIPYSNDMAIMPRRPDSPPLPLLRNEEVIAQQPSQGALIQAFTHEAVDFIKSNRTRPFFLYLAHMHVHLPHYVMEPFASNSKNGSYGAAVAAVDWSTGVLMAELRKLGLEENTIVIFTSDNGSRRSIHGESNGVLRGAKGSTWEGGQRVPCIIKWPKQIEADVVSDVLVTSMDFYPTIASMIGNPLSEFPKRDGHDVSDIWRGMPDAKSPYDAFFYYNTNRLQAVRSGDWKLRLNSNGGRIHTDQMELFNLADDIGEQKNLAEEHPNIVKNLLQLMDIKGKQIGDKLKRYPGTERRPNAINKNPKPLTETDPNYPYIEPSYRLNQAG